MAELMVDEDAKKVLHTLVKFKSMPFLELTSVCDINEKRMEDIINHFEKHALVKVLNPGDIYETIVTLKEKGFALARSS